MQTATTYVKRTQRDYSLSFKLQVVKEIECGELSATAAAQKYGIQSRSTLVTWLKKYGTFDWEHQTPSSMAKSPEQRILELEAKVKLLSQSEAHSNTPRLCYPSCVSCAKHTHHSTKNRWAKTLLFAERKIKRPKSRSRQVFFNFTSKPSVNYT
jgi:transposase-like protein